MRLELFRAGDYGDKGSYTESDLQEIVDTYNESGHEAPAVIGHSASDKDPAYGFFGKLERRGRSIWAEFKEVVPAFKEMFDKGLYKKWSVEIYKNYNGTGKKSLRRVAFLGAEPPEIKGLQYSFGDSTPETIVLFQETIEIKEGKPKMTPEELLAENQNLKEELAGIKATLAKLAEEKKATEAKVADAEAQAFCESKGIAPALRDKAKILYKAIKKAAENEDIKSFSEGTNILEVFGELIPKAKVPENLEKEDFSEAKKASEKEQNKAALRAAICL